MLIGLLRGLGQSGSFSFSLGPSTGFLPSQRYTTKNQFILKENGQIYFIMNHKNSHLSLNQSTSYLQSLAAKPSRLYLML